jgi:asparagine synthase (glutamine-hydrolysing)
MCGIAGIFHYRDSAARACATTLDRMIDTIAHRGPDGRGTIICGNVGLGHQRLAILDPSCRGAQPMTTASGRSTIVYNGEVYNFGEIRDDLKRDGFLFTTGTDTEVVASAFERWGADAFARLNGIYALALWDHTARALYLARDRFGVKPLYVHDDGTTVRFGSELKAVLADTAVARIPDWAGLRGVLELGYTAAPRTCFRGVTQIAPATVQRYTVSGKNEWRTWDPAIPEPTATTVAEALDRFDDVLDRAIRRQMVSDVPIGAFLSGGLDSTRVVEGMSHGAADKIQAFTVGFTAKGFDESGIAADSAGHLDVDHVVERIDVDVADTAQRVSDISDDPFADSSALAMFHLCRVAAARVKVVLAGDGADELLAGYSTYRAERFAAPLRMLPASVRTGALLPIARLIPPIDQPYSLHQVARRLLLGAQESPARTHASWRRCLYDTDESLLLTADAHRSLRAAADPIDAFAAEYARWPDGTTPLRRMMAADLLYHLPNDMLVKVDRMSMAHGLEVRVPMLDHDFVDFTLALSPALINGGRQGAKRLLKLSLAHRMPAFDTRRPKRGLLVPVGVAFRGELGVLLMDALPDGGPFERSQVERLLARHKRHRVDASFELYAVLMVSLWWQRFLA